MTPMLNGYVETRRRQLEAAAPIISHLIGDACAAVPGGMSFVINQLAYVEAGLFERKYAPLLYQRLVTISTEGGPGITSFVFRTLDGVGQGKRISNCADDIPYVDFSMATHVSPVVLGGVGYHYQTEELRQAAQLNIPLSATKARLAMVAYERHMNKVALIGEDHDLFGLTNNPSVQILEAAAPWTSSTLFTGFIADINSLLSHVYTASLMNTYANTLLIPPSVNLQWINTYNPTQGDMTLDYITNNNFTSVSGGGDLLIMQVPQLEHGALNASGETGKPDCGRRLVAYNRDGDNVVMHIPMPLTFLPPQPQNLDLKIPGEYKYGGVEIRYLNSIVYMDNV